MPIRIHLGCGTKRLAGLVHVDARAEVKPDYVADVRDLTCFDDDSADLIYFCHGLEHLSFRAVGGAFKEWGRVLRPGGELRLAMPDFETVAKAYNDGVNLRPLRWVLMGGQGYEENFHYSTWDLDTLKIALEMAGYTDVARYDARAWLPGGYSDWSVDEITTIAGYDISLNVRATWNG